MARACRVTCGGPPADTDSPLLGIKRDRCARPEVRVARRAGTWRGSDNTDELYPPERVAAGSSGHPDAPPSDVGFSPLLICTIQSICTLCSRV